ncbi:adenylyl-sulfate kinase [Nostoc sp. C117]|uniref:adenylyl-sulfate kinase n=1 Tax=Nostoc sp. C117 TaxID=3349875 RepID=UPI00370DBADF
MNHSKNCPGMTLWFTGLSGAGKTTISQVVEQVLISEGYLVERLDGDIVRQFLTKDLGFSKADRDENLRRIGFVAHLLTKNGVIVLVSTISPYQDIRAEMRQKIGQFAEVYVNASVETCEKRDTKGLYRKARNGEILNFTGINDPYEPPVNPEVTCDTNCESVDESAAKVIEYVKQRMTQNLKPSIPLRMI